MFFVIETCNTNLIISLIIATVLAVLVAAFTAITHIRYRKRTKDKLSVHGSPQPGIMEDNQLEDVLVSGDAYSNQNETMVKRKFWFTFKITLKLKKGFNFINFTVYCF